MPGGKGWRRVSSSLSVSLLDMAVSIHTRIMYPGSQHTSRRSFKTEHILNTVQKTPTRTKQLSFVSPNQTKGNETRTSGVKVSWLFLTFWLVFVSETDITGLLIIPATAEPLELMAPQTDTPISFTYSKRTSKPNRSSGTVAANFDTTIDA